MTADAMHRFSAGSPRRGTLLFAALTVVAGCAEKRPAAWTPAPRVVWGEIANQPVPTPVEGYLVSDKKPTAGLFPASLAVARVAVAEDATQVLGVRPILFADPRNEFLQWNLAVCDQMAVSEIFPIGPSSVGGSPVNPEQVLASFRALGARLGLVYAVNELSPTETELLGILYDVEGAQPVATMHSHAVSKVPEEQLEKEDLDRWENDSKALARRDFEKSVRASIHELILHDEPPTGALKAGWDAANQRRTAVWPPPLKAKRP